MKARIFEMSLRLINALNPPLLLSSLGIAAMASAMPLAVSLQTNPGLAADLSSRVKTDQDARNAWIKLTQVTQRDVRDSGEQLALFTRLQKIDRDNLAWLKKVVQKNGWPGKTKVGKS